jgi:hypothetical protein
MPPCCLKLLGLLFRHSSCSCRVMLVVKLGLCGCVGRFELCLFFSTVWGFALTLTVCCVDCQGGWDRHTAGFGWVADAGTTVPCRHLSGAAW